MENPTNRLPSNYYPKARPVQELFNEDETCFSAYTTIPDDDENILVYGGGVGTEITSIKKWDDAMFDRALIDNIVKSGYLRPRKIQAHAIPLIMQGVDLKGHAETGSGKTAAFLLPIIQKARKERPPTGLFPKPAPVAIVIEPTRELCLQVYDQARKLANGLNVKIGKAYGELAVHMNKRELVCGCDILIATVGRLRHFVAGRDVRLDRLKFFVLDESDYLLLDPKWLEDLRAIMEFEGFPNKNNRQTLLFSATFPKEVDLLAGQVLKPNRIFVSNKKLVAANHRIDQKFTSVRKCDKMRELVKLLKEDLLLEAAENGGQKKRVLVFTHSKKEADILTTHLTNNGVRAESINANQTQRVREQSLLHFRKGEVQVLVATDVCARGIDVKGLDCVINYDLPSDLVSYVHRIGRTGRIKEGFATSFIDEFGDADISIAPHLIRMLKEAGKEVPIFLKAMVGGGSSPPASSADENELFEPPEALKQAEMTPESDKSLEIEPRQDTIEAGQNEENLASSAGFSDRITDTPTSSRYQQQQGLGLSLNSGINDIWTDKDSTASDVPARREYHDHWEFDEDGNLINCLIN